MPERVQLPPIRRKSTERLARSGRVQSPMPERAKTLEKVRTPKRAKTSDRGKAPVVQVSQPPAPDCMIVEPWGQPPPQALTVREQRITPTPCARNREMTAESNCSPLQSSRKKKKVLTPERSGSEDGTWEHTRPLAAEESDEEVTPSPSMRKIFT